MREETSSSFRWRPTLSSQQKLRNKMKELFAVILRHGTAWQASRSLEEQEDWEAHRCFMNALEEEGFVMLGGPLEGDGRGSSYTPRDDPGRDRRSTLGRSVAPAGPSSRKPSYAVGTAIRLAAVSRLVTQSRRHSLSQPLRCNRSSGRRS